MASDLDTRRWIASAADEKAVAQGCRFDIRAAERVRSYFSTFLRHSKGEFAGKPFELEEWQWKSTIGPLYGWKRPNGTRRYRRLSKWVAKKNGKSTECAGLITFGLVADDEPGAEVYGAAANRIQAQIIYNEVVAMIRQSPQLESRLVINETQRKILDPKNHSFYQVLSKDSQKTGHGVNAHLCVIDELHVVDRALYNTLRYAGAARRQPLLIEISTAGDDKTSLGYERYTYAKRLLKGEIEDPETLAVIYEADGNEVWEDEAQWHKANPSLGVTIPLDGFRSDFNEAKNGLPDAQATFKQLRLNLWQEQIFAWLPLDIWDACRAEVDLDSLAGLPCWGALDLASKMDLCAWALLFQTSKEEYMLVLKLFAPKESDSRRQKENRARLLPWMLSKDIHATEGDVTDYDAIEEIVKEDCDRYRVREVAFDPWNATQLVSHLQGHGIKCVEFGQTARNYNEPMREFEKHARSGKLKHQGNPVMRWMLGHLKARKDSNGNLRPDKEHSGDHIDGVTATLMALGRALLAAREGESVYDRAGVEFV